MLGFSALDTTALASTGQIDIVVLVTGVSATGALGDETVVTSVAFSVTGVFATGAASDVTVDL